MPSCMIVPIDWLVMMFGTGWMCYLNQNSNDFRGWRTVARRISCWKLNSQLIQTYYLTEKSIFIDRSFHLTQSRGQQWWLHKFTILILIALSSLIVFKYYKLETLMKGPVEKYSHRRLSLRIVLLVTTCSSSYTSSRFIDSQRKAFIIALRFFFIQESFSLLKRNAFHFHDDVSKASFHDSVLLYDLSWYNPSLF